MKKDATGTERNTAQMDQDQYCCMDMLLVVDFGNESLQYRKRIRRYIKPRLSRIFLGNDGVVHRRFDLNYNLLCKNP